MNNHSTSDRPCFKTIFVCWFLACTSIQCQGLPKESKRDVPIRYKYGYINQKGEIAIETKYEDACSFSEGLAAVKIGGKWGYIDKKGKWIIKPVYGDIDGMNYREKHKFSEGLACVRTRKGCGYMDRHGNFKIAPKYYTATPFSGGYACVGMYLSEIDELYYGVIDHNGMFVLHPQFSFEIEISEGIALINMTLGNEGIPEQSLWRYISLSGKTWIECKTKRNVSLYGRFSGGLAVVEMLDPLPSQPDTASLSYGYMDTSGRFAIEPRFCCHACDFSEGLAAVESAWEPEGPGWGFIDKTGGFVIKPQFDWAFPFHEGIARVSQKNKYGFIGATGQFLIEPQYDTAGDFQDGIAFVSKDGKQYAIDREGTVVFSHEYEHPLNFSDGLAVIRAAIE